MDPLLQGDDDSKLSPLTMVVRSLHSLPLAAGSFLSILQKIIDFQISNSHFSYAQ